MRCYRVHLVYGPYTHTDPAVEAEDEEHACAIAWERLRRRGFLTLAMAATSEKAEEIACS